DGSPVRVTEIMYNPPEAPGPVALADEDFNDAVADGFVERVGTWTYPAGRYHGTPVTYRPPHPDSRILIAPINIALAIVPQQSDLPEQFRVATTIKRDASNSRTFIVFDYHSRENFKFAGAWSNSQWVIGRYNYLSYRNNWYLDAIGPATISTGVDYDLELSVIDGAASLKVNGQIKVAWDFDQDLAEGQIGIATRDGAASFDDFTAEVDFDADAYEFVELLNTGGSSVNLGATHFADGIEFSSPRTDLGAGQRALIVKNLSAFESRYDTTGMNIIGQYSGNFANGGEAVALNDAASEGIESFTYNDWYGVTDGGGWSLHLIDPATALSALGDKESWRPSEYALGSPGGTDSDVARGSVVINEVLSHSDGPSGDWVELYNTTGAPIGIGNWYLSDDANDLTKYRIPPGTTINAGEYLLFTASDHFGGFFGFSEHGEGAYLTGADADTTLRGFRNVKTFGAAPGEKSFGLYATSVGRDFVLLSSPTPGVANAEALIGPVVINEIMYHPLPGGDEFLELYNITPSSVELYDVSNPTHTWKLDGAMEYIFPESVAIPAYGMVVLTEVDVTAPGAEAAFRSAYGIPGGVGIYGPWSGSLSNGGESVKLYMPGDPDPGTGQWSYIRVDRVVYDDLAPWPLDADGLGSSLERRVSGDYGNDVANWQSGLSGGTPGEHNVGANAPPAMDAGADQAVLLPHEVTLDGMVNDDGLPSGGTLTMAWTKQSGPGTVTFGDDSLAVTTAGFSTVGTYVLRLTADDGGQQAYAEMTVTATAIAGDVTCNGIVDITDLGALAANWQATGAVWAQGDFTGDGVVNITDLGALAANW
ncbi:hypothetical protein LCGC14_1892990, partial [marine sediment metagenome]